MLARALHPLIGLALPPRCPGCGVPVAEDHRFCAGCWAGLRFIGPPWCASCQVPFAHDLGDGVRCGSCLASPPIHDGVRAAVGYGEVAKALALRLKYGRRAGLAATMAAAMARVVPDDVEVLVPVPLHRWRLWTRGYNQAALIARALAARRPVEVDLDVLVRRQRTPPLRGMNGSERRRTVARAFALDPRRADRIAGRHVGLVDDVYTSGATAAACTRVLRAGGAARVTILCWSRVLAEERAD